MNEKRTTISLKGLDLLDFLGHQDANLRRLEERFEGTLVVRGDTLILQGEPGRVDAMEKAMGEVLRWAQEGRRIDPESIDRILAGEAPKLRGAVAEGIHLNGKQRVTIHARTRGQARYLEAIRDHDVVFAVGPAGTGKTYLAVVLALMALQNREVERIFLVRPAVEAGEQLGFLPGDLQEKVDPYLRPLHDALSECLGTSRLTRLLANGTIEVAPLAYMRGRTLNHAFVILDEGQNTTLGQMKMFLTRIGEGTRAIVTGDITQIDITQPETSGLVRVRSIIQDVPGVSFIDLDERDVVRHPLVRRIVAAFEENAASNGQRNGAGTPEASQ
ncbi:MAG TPA: PhoH family protein [Candidatus Krumholzibacteria bacterium]|nr:PhoH family protein [Candidatus Krumholzibacteria bacterium]